MDASYNPKHRQQHDGPEGRLEFFHQSNCFEEASKSSFIISTKLDFQNFDQSQALESQTKFSIKILTKLQLQHIGPKLRHNFSIKILTKSASNICFTSLDQTSTSTSLPNLKILVQNLLKLLTKLELRYLDENLGSKSLPNFSFKISTKLQPKNLYQTSD